MKANGRSKGTVSSPSRRVFTAVVQREGRLYVARCPEVGTVSQGTSIEKAVENLREATELYLEEFPLSEASHPFLTTFEAVSA